MRRLFKPLSRLFCTQKKSTVVKDFFQDGYSVINFNYYCDTPQKSIIDSALSTYETLSKDEFSSGNRYRAHSRYHWCTVNSVSVLDSSNDYFQSRSYNSVDGDKVRRFAMIPSLFLENSIVSNMLEKDIDIAKEINSVTFDSSLVIGLHQIRYKATNGTVAYSSPAWLHRDDEPIVFVHVFNFTQNLVGGDNVIAKTGSDISRAIRISPLQTLLLSKNVLHAVTPMSSLDEKEAVRDILLVTLHNKKDAPVLDSPSDRSLFGKGNSIEKISQKKQCDHSKSSAAKGSSISNFTSFFKNESKNLVDFRKNNTLTPLLCQI